MVWGGDEIFWKSCSHAALVGFLTVDVLGKKPKMALSGEVKLARC
jgi:hypothetical protein